MLEKHVGQTCPVINPRWLPSSSPSLSSAATVLYCNAHNIVYIYIYIYIVIRAAQSLIILYYAGLRSTSKLNSKPTSPPKKCNFEWRCVTPSQKKKQIFQKPVPASSKWLFWYTKWRSLNPWKGHWEEPGGKHLQSPDAWLCASTFWFACRVSSLRHGWDGPGEFSAISLLANSKPNCVEGKAKKQESPKKL